MADSKLVTSMKNASRELRSKFIENICNEMYEASMTSKNKKVPWGFVSKLLKDAKKEEPWVTKNMINFAFKKFRSKKNLGNEEELDSKSNTTINESTTTATTGTYSGGRPKGTTIVNQHHQKEALRAAKNEIATLYQEKKTKCNNNGEKLPNGWLKMTIDNVVNTKGLPPSTSISLKTIRNRKQAIVLSDRGSATLMSGVEPQLVTLILAMAQARRCLRASECLSLANDLIKGTEVEKKIIERKKKRNELYDDNSPVLGKKYWQLFNKRWKHKLVTRRGQKFALDRSNSLTYHNVKKMYDDVYNALVESGNAIQTQEHSSKYDGPLMTRFHLTHPNNCLVVDEVGTDTSQKGDGHIGGAKYYCGRGCVPQNQSSSNDKHFTMLGFTALSGQPVMCLLIIAGVQEKWEVETGIDTDAVQIGDPGDPDFFVNNRGKGKMFPLGPECTFNGKKVPTMVRWSQSGSITSIILRDALATMDHHDLFERSSNRKPFLLLDGHHSRFELPFLEYVTNADHPWMICIGVPYGTSLWQVADSKEQNVSYKIAIANAKKQILEKRLDMYLDSPGIYSTDIMIIVNDAWEQSFARVDLNKKAISDRGWGPLNYNLLNNEEIKAMMTDSENREYLSMMKLRSMSKTRSEPSMSTSISDLTDENEVCSSSRKNIQPNYDPKYLTKVISDSVTVSKLNFSAGRAAEVARRLIHDHDIREAREANKKLAEKGKVAKKKLEEAKKLTAMLNFNTIGCKVGEDSLKIRMEMAKKKKESEDKVQLKKDKIVNERKRKYDEIQSEIRSKNLPLAQLSIVQLKQLCLHKKRKEDKVSISKLKRDELLQLWMLWKDRCDEDDLQQLSKTNPPNVSHASALGNSTGTDDAVVAAVVTCDDSKTEKCEEVSHIIECSDTNIVYDSTLII